MTGSRCKGKQGKEGLVIFTWKGFMGMRFKSTELWSFCKLSVAFISIQLLSWTNSLSAGGGPAGCLAGSLQPNNLSSSEN